MLLSRLLNSTALEF